QVGDREMLLSDTVDFAEEAKKEGVDVRTHVYPGMFHIFQMGLYLFPEAVSAWEEVGRFINEQKEHQES
ncbi:MAG: alpha/beta hydrolase fold domain-containing protein, partial [Lachnospiraceae bacterium]|nr:alpha/beta hydrolase fold domain-containing protein [Lachnospiraceae bacterium]